MPKKKKQSARIDWFNYKEFTKKAHKKLNTNPNKKNNK